MLSIEECRKILSPKEYSDQEIEKLRDGCYQLASIMLANYLANKRLKNADKKPPLKENGFPQ